MLCNETTAVSLKDRILLVPYEAAHVTTYHEWMKDPAIQQSTASEPLTLPEEHAMQQSWRTSHDKLTFIICLPLLPESPSNTNPSGGIEPYFVRGGIDDRPLRMLGDVNLFIYDNDEEEEDEKVESKEKKTLKPLIGELELMIAPTTHRRQGHGRSALLAFLHYILRHLDEILSTYRLGVDDPVENICQSLGQIQFKVKIGEDNAASLRLFESLGFVYAREKANYFGEFEMGLKEEVVERWYEHICGEDERREGGGAIPFSEGYVEAVYVPANEDAESSS